MGNQSQRSDDDRPSGTSERDELRTLAFRMREIQRLLSVRVEQENRRLEAEGLEAVPTARFQEQPVPEEKTE